jgi:hypothetical protein
LDYDVKERMLDQYDETWEPTSEMLTRYGLLALTVKDSVLCTPDFHWKHPKYIE